MSLKYFTYWIRNPDHTDVKSQGYVGISHDAKNRLTQHIWNAKNGPRRMDHHFKNSLVTGNFVHEILLCSDLISCQNLERELRPRIMMGWNMAIGADGGNVYKHGLTCSKSKRDFYNMLSRARDRGLTVCDKWNTDINENALVDFDKFRSDNQHIGTQLTLPKSGLLSHDTVLFLTVSERSRIVNRKFEVDGEFYTIQELGAKFGLKPNTISTRLKRGWSIDRIIKPVQSVGR